jgi:transcriptional regulator with XRE-family HTH domain
MARRNPHLLAFGSKLAALRKERKLTQEKLAEKAKLGSQYISNVERGAVNPSLLVLRSIAGALGLSLARMLADAGEIDVEVAAVLGGHSNSDRKKALALVQLFLARDEES